MKIALGTAQFGSAYGVANTNGQVSLESVRHILRTSRSFGVDTIDTAIAYGDSENRLGAVGVNGLNVITKLGEVPDYISDIDKWIVEQVNSSASRLNIKRFYGLLLHRPTQLLGSRGTEIVEALNRLKDMGLIEKAGISIYDPHELHVISSLYDFDLVQCPYNAIDRRLVDTGWLKKLKDSGVEVHVRSCFMQGLLLLPRAKLPKYFTRWSDLFDAWKGWLEESGVSPVVGCIAFALAQSEIDKVIVGVESSEQLKQIFSAAQNLSINQFPSISSTDSCLVNPSNWRS